ncbi:hypothetical protein [Escherichia coli]|uniref:hypothetical protein n=1 Tax=Escherichia coli TaxID=562 RepID=UPI002025D60B|nr:hypothetical protein [Escherichia coli]
MKSIYLKSVLAFYICCMAMIVCIPLHRLPCGNNLQLYQNNWQNLQETPDTAEAFQETLNYQSEPFNTW